MNLTPGQYAELDKTKQEMYLHQAKVFLIRLAEVLKDIEYQENLITLLSLFNPNANIPGGDLDTVIQAWRTGKLDQALEILTKEEELWQQ